MLLGLDNTMNLELKICEKYRRNWNWKLVFIIHVICCLAHITACAYNEIKEYRKELKFVCMIAERFWCLPHRANIELFRIVDG